jgi:hypothetical protein
MPLCALYSRPENNARRCGPWRLARGLLAASLVLLTALAPPEAARAQADSSRAALTAKTVVAEYELYAGNKTLKEARRQAIDRAQAEAVRKAIGTQVQAERRSSTIETGDEVVSRFSQVVRTGASGRVVDSEVLEASVRERAGSTFQYVQIRATVEPTTGRPDPGFTVTLRLTDDDQTFVARDRLPESDEIIAEIEVTKDAYLTLFSVTADTLQVIWPNSLSKDTFVAAGTSIQFPSPALRARGLRLRVEIPDGRKQITERLVAVATKQQIPFQEVPRRHIEDGVLASAQASVQALNRWLVEIPLGQRALQSVTYDVVRAD